MSNQKEGTLVLIISENTFFDLEQKNRPIPSKGSLVHWCDNFYILGNLLQDGFVLTGKVNNLGEHKHIRLVTPIIVCDDEIKEGDLTYHAQEPGVYYPKNGGLSGDKKILVNTPQIPDNIIQAIVNRDLKDGDKVKIDIQGFFTEINNSDEWSYNVKLEDNKAIVTIPEKERGINIISVKDKETYTKEEVEELLNWFTKDFLNKI